MTVGRNDMVKVSDIVKSISENADIPGKNIGRISLFDKFCFVEIPSGYAERVISSVDKTLLNGKKIRVQPARARKAATPARNYN